MKAAQALVTITANGRTCGTAKGHSPTSIRVPQQLNHIGLTISNLIGERRRGFIAAGSRQMREFRVQPGGEFSFQLDPSEVHALMSLGHGVTVKLRGCKPLRVRFTR